MPAAAALAALAASEAFDTSGVSAQAVDAGAPLSQLMDHAVSDSGSAGAVSDGSDAGAVSGGGGDGEAGAACAEGAAGAGGAAVLWREEAPRLSPADCVQLDCRPMAGAAVLWREEAPRLFVGEGGSLTCAHVDIVPQVMIAVRLPLIALIAT